MCYGETFKKNTGSGERCGEKDTAKVREKEEVTAERRGKGVKQRPQEA